MAVTRGPRDGCMTEEIRLDATSVPPSASSPILTRKLTILVPSRNRAISARLREGTRIVSLRVRMGDDAEGGTDVASSLISSVMQPSLGPRVTAIVLNYDGLELLQTLLPSLLAQDYRDMRVVVVDNGSRDGSASMVRERWPEIDLLEIPDNVGVA